MKVDELPKIRKLKYSPDMNPLVESCSIEVKRRYVTTGIKRDLVDPTTGEFAAASVIRMVEEKDDQEFVKVFADGIKAAYGLTKTAYRVFQLVLDQYQQEPMSGGFVDSVYLVWFDGGLSGQSVDLSEPTLNRGLRELLGKGFLAPRSPNMYWVNPALFFKGDRVAFVKEYHRKQTKKEGSNRNL